MGIEKFDQIRVSYDPEADVLYMSEGNPRETVCQLLDDGVIVRKDLSTKKVVGFTIVDFVSHFSKAMPQSIPIRGNFDTLQPA